MQAIASVPFISTPYIHIHIAHININTGFLPVRKVGPPCSQLPYNPLVLDYYYTQQMICVSQSRSKWCLNEAKRLEQDSHHQAAPTEALQY